MLFRRLAVALILAMVVALVGLACAESATATPEAMMEEPDSTSFTSGSDSYEVQSEPIPTAMMEAMPEPTAMPDIPDSGQDSSSSYTVGATAMPAPTATARPAAESDSGSTVRSLSSTDSAPVPTAVPAATTFQDYRRSPLVTALGTDIHLSDLTRTGPLSTLA